MKNKNLIISIFIVVIIAFALMFIFPQQITGNPISNSLKIQCNQYGTNCAGGNCFDNFSNNIGAVQNNVCAIPYQTGKAPFLENGILSIKNCGAVLSSGNVELLGNLDCSSDTTQNSGLKIWNSDTYLDLKNNQIIGPSEPSRSAVYIWNAGGSNQIKNGRITSYSPTSFGVLISSTSVAFSNLKIEGIGETQLSIMDSSVSFNNVEIKKIQAKAQRVSLKRV